MNVDEPQVSITSLDVHELDDHGVALDVSFRLSRPALLTFTFEIAGYPTHTQQNEHPASPPLPLRKERASHVWHVRPGDLYITVKITSDGLHKDTFLKLYQAHIPTE